MKRLNLILSIAFLLLGFHSFAQTDKETTVKIVADKNYTFIANSALPMSNNDVNRVLAMMPGSQGGSSINLSGSQYDVKVTKDSVVAYLPYFGRSFSAPMDPTQGGIKFTSKNFTYKESKNKKGTYIIQINTKDVPRENYQFTINISTNGYASLTASSMNKQPIIFNGYLDEPKKQD